MWKNNDVLDKKDVKTIQDMIINALGEFFEKVLSPYLDDRFSEIDKRFGKIDKKLQENHDDRERIFRKLDRNEDQHDEILLDQDKYEKAIKGHERRIKRLETATA